MTAPIDHDAAPAGRRDRPRDRPGVPYSKLPYVPMSSGEWRYSPGGTADDADVAQLWPDRGVYRRDGNGDGAVWRHVADLPHVHAQIIRRDGSGRVAGTDYLLSAHPGEPAQIFTRDMIRSGEWADVLNIPTSEDDKVIKAAATAIRALARTAPVHEAVPRATDDGRITVPVPESLPDGYLATAPTDRDRALNIWRNMVTVAARSPRMALALAATAVAPYVGPMRRQSHFVHLYGESDQGKSTTSRMCGAVWGDSYRRGGTFRSWNTTKVGIGRLLGTLGILPPVLDEAGMARFQPSEWGQVIYELCEGAQRTAGDRSGGIRLSAPWDGIVISAGNGRITANLGAGKFAGIAKRVIELGTPFTLTAADAEWVDRNGPLCFGHLGAALLARFTVPDVAGLIEQAAEVLPLPPGGNPRTLAKHLHAHIAGAAMVDAVTGSGTTLQDAALIGAREYLAVHGHEQVHDADRLLDAVRESIAREPSAWPTVAMYRENLMPFDEHSGIPRHGVDRRLIGVRADDDSWVALFPGPFHEMAEAIELDESVALDRLYARKVLQVPASQRKIGRWQAPVRLQPKPAQQTRMYKLVLPPDVADDDGQEDATDRAAPVPAPGALIPPPAAPSGSGWGPGTIGDAVYQESARERVSVPEPRPAAAPAPTTAPAAPAPSRPAEPRPAARTEVRPSPSRSPSPSPSPAAGAWRYGTVAVLDVDGLHRPGVDRPDPVTVRPTGRSEVAALAAERGIDRIVVMPGVLADVDGLPDHLSPDETVRHPWAALADSAWSTRRHDGADDVMEPYSTVHHVDGRTVVIVLAGYDPVFGGQLPDARELAAAHALFRREVGAWWWVSAPYMLRSQIERTLRRSRKFTDLARCEAITSESVPAVGETALITRASRPLDAAEDGAVFLIGLDRNSAFPTAMASTRLGIGEPRHIADPFRFDTAVHGKRAGYWRITSEVLIDPRVDDLLNLAEGWLTTPEAVALAEHGLLPEIAEAWVWDDSAEVLRTLGRTIRDARKALIGLRDQGVTGAATALALVKAMATALGALNPGSVPADRRGPLWRPDWRDQIRGQAQANILRQILAAGRRSDRWPVAVNVDELVYASDDDPAATAKALGMVYDPSGAAGNGWKSKGPVSVPAIRRQCGELTFWPMFTQLREGGK